MPDVERYRQKTKGWMRQGQYEAVITACDEALALPSLSDQDLVYFMGVKASALSLANPGWLARSIALLKDALSYAAGDPALVAQVHTELSLAYTRAGSIDRVTEVYGQYDLLASAYPIPEVLRFRPRMFFNLGKVHKAWHRLDRAEEFFRRAIAEFPTVTYEPDLQELPFLIARVQHELAGVLIRKGDLLPATTLISAAAQVLPQEAWEAKIQNRKAELALAERRYDVALMLGTEAVEHAGKDLQTRCDALFSVAQAHEGLGSTVLALKYAKEARQLAADISYPQLLDEVAPLVARLVKLHTIGEV